MPRIYLDRSHPQLCVQFVDFSASTIVVAKLFPHAFHYYDASISLATEHVILGVFLDLPPSKQDSVNVSLAPAC